MSQATNNTAKRLKPLPCPFCGRRYTGNEITEKGRARAFECPRCGAHGPYPNSALNKPGKTQKYYDNLSVEAWNRRVVACSGNYAR